MTAGFGSTTDGDYPHRLSLLSGRAIYNGGVGGDTSTQIATRMLADTSKHSWPTIIWAGRNNYGSPTTVKADIASMIASLGHSKYIILGVINGDYADEYNGQAKLATIATLNADLAATYGAHFIDIRPYLVALYDPSNPQDVIDHGNNVPPSSLRDDELHLNDAGYQAVASKVYEARAQLGASN